MPIGMSVHLDLINIVFHVIEKQWCANLHIILLASMFMYSVPQNLPVLRYQHLLTFFLLFQISKDLDCCVFSSTSSHLLFSKVKIILYHIPLTLMLWTCLPVTIAWELNHTTAYQEAPPYSHCKTFSLSGLRNCLKCSFFVGVEHAEKNCNWVWAFISRAQQSVLHACDSNL